MGFISTYAFPIRFWSNEIQLLIKWQVWNFWDFFNSHSLHHPHRLLSLAKCNFWLNFERAHDGESRSTVPISSPKNKPSAAGRRGNFFRQLCTLGIGTKTPSHSLPTFNFLWRQPPPTSGGFALANVGGFVLGSGCGRFIPEPENSDGSIWRIPRGPTNFMWGWRIYGLHLPEGEGVEGKFRHEKVDRTFLACHNFVRNKCLVIQSWYHSTAYLTPYWMVYSQ